MMEDIWAFIKQANKPVQVVCQPRPEWIVVATVLAKKFVQLGKEFFIVKEPASAEYPTVILGFDSNIGCAEPIIEPFKDVTTKQMLTTIYGEVPEDNYLSSIISIISDSDTLLSAAVVRGALKKKSDMVLSYRGILPLNSWLEKNFAADHTKIKSMLVADGVDERFMEKCLLELPEEIQLSVKEVLFAYLLENKTTDEVERVNKEMYHITTWPFADDEVKTLLEILCKKTRMDLAIRYCLGQETAIEKIKKEIFALDRL